MRLMMALPMVVQLLQAQPSARPTPELTTLKREVARLLGEGKYAQAIPLENRVVAIVEKDYGPDHPETIKYLNGLAIAYFLNHDYAKAEPVFARVLAFMEKRQPDDPETTKVLDRLALVYFLLRKYEKAEPLYQQLLAITERSKGPDHPDTAAYLYDIAMLYQAQTQLVKAREFYARALQTMAKARPNDPETARVRNNLAEIQQKLGDYREAETLFKENLKAREAVLGAEHPDTAETLNDLALLYQNQGAYAKAEPLYLRALAIMDKQKPDSPQTAEMLSNLATLYGMERAYGKEEPLLIRALAIMEKAEDRGPSHPNIELVLNNLALLYLHQEEYAKAEPLLARSLEIRETAFGPDHPDTAIALSNLAGLYMRQGNYGKAETLYARALRNTEKFWGPEHVSISLFRENLAIVYCMEGSWTKAAAQLHDLVTNQRARWDLAFGRDTEKMKVINRRGLLLSMLHAGSQIPGQRSVYLPLFLQTALASKARLTDELRAILEALKEHAGPDDRKLMQGLLDTWDQIAALSQKIQISSPPSEDRDQLQNLKLRESDLTAELAARSADFRQLTADPTLQKVADRLHNQILIEILRVARYEPVPGKGSGDQIYTAVALFSDGRVDMVDLGSATQIDSLIDSYLKQQEIRDNRDPDTLAQKLGEAIVGPIAKLAGSTNEWFFAPDGKIRLIPLNALRLKSKYVAETYRIWPIGSGRDLLTLDNQKAGGGGGDLIIANPDFGAGKFAELRETEDEADSIAEIFPNARIVKGANATKSFLLNLPDAPRFLHVATHAFYKPGDGDPATRSGIALKGANIGPDGILTALEAQRLELRGTQLVVLSACDTGIGEVSFGDGIVGLQRSLTLAGAKTQMLTEWHVNSEKTEDFMKRFYTKLAEGKTKGDAWLETQRDLIREQVIPFLWAPFVLYGDPGRLGENRQMHTNSR